MIECLNCIGEFKINMIKIWAYDVISLKGTPTLAFATLDPTSDYSSDALTRVFGVGGMESTKTALWSKDPTALADSDPCVGIEFPN